MSDFLADMGIMMIRRTELRIYMPKYCGLEEKTLVFRKKLCYNCKMTVYIDSNAINSAVRSSGKQ